MPNYLYVAKNLKGDSISGNIEAKNKHNLAEILKNKGYILVSAEEQKNGCEKKDLSAYIPFLNHISLDEKIMFLRNLRVMIKAGVSLPRALGILVEQTKNKKFKETISEIKKNVIKGETFSHALRKYPNIFNELFISMVEVGEESGTLENVLETLSEQMNKEHQIVSKVKGAMMYPAVILFAMTGIGILMMIIVVPKLSKVFSDLKIDLPVTTKFVIYFSNSIINYWYIIIAITVIFFFLIKSFLKTRSGKMARDGLLLKTPIFSSIIKKTNSARTVRTLSSLIDSGIPITRSLEITSKTLGNFYYEEALKKASQDIKKGDKLADILGNYEDIYPDLVIQMIRVGEETGETAVILKQLAEFYEEEVENITKNLSSIIEPVLMLIIGSAVGFFAISIIQPIYGIVQGF